MSHDVKAVLIATYPDQLPAWAVHFLNGVGKLQVVDDRENDRQNVAAQIAEMKDKSAKTLAPLAKKEKSLKAEQARRDLRDLRDAEIDFLEVSLPSCC